MLASRRGMMAWELCKSRAKKYRGRSDADSLRCSYLRPIVEGHFKRSKVASAGSIMANTCCLRVSLVPGATCIGTTGPVYITDGGDVVVVMEVCIDVDFLMSSCFDIIGCFTCGRGCSVGRAVCGRDCFVGKVAGGRESSPYVAGGSDIRFRRLEGECMKRNHVKHSKTTAIMILLTGRERQLE